MPQEEVDEFVDNVKERKMGQLFDHFEDYDVQATRAEAKQETKIEIALNMIKEGQISLEKIAQYAKLSLDQVKEIAGQQGA